MAAGCQEVRSRVKDEARKRPKCQAKEHGFDLMGWRAIEDF